MLPASWRGPRANPRGSLWESAEREVVDGLDIMILRELTGDVYFGDPRGTGVNAAGEREAFDTMRYSEPEIERIAHVAFRTARSYSYRRYGFVGLFGPCDVDTLIYTSGASAPD